MQQPAQLRLPVDVLSGPRVLLDWIRDEFGDVSDVYVDSLKDIALDLSKDENSPSRTTSANSSRAVGSPARSQTCTGLTR